MSMGEMILLERKLHTIRAEMQTLPQVCNRACERLQSATSTLASHAGQSQPSSSGREAASRGAPGTSHGKLGGSCHHTG